MSERRAQVHMGHPLPKARRCELLGIARSTAYYRPEPVNEEDLRLMRLIDEIHLLWPFYGSRRIRNELEDRGHTINRKHIRRLMRQMDLRALYPRRRTSQPGNGHKIYPYLLRALVIDRPNQVWATDICYIPMAKGFMYLVAIMDWHSRRVLSWRVSNTLDTDFCIEALEEALQRFGTPQIFNTDQGSQFTSEAFTGVLKRHGIDISMDGKGRWVDNVFVERLWRSVKYEDVYLRAYETPIELRAGLDRYFKFYNTKRRHSALGRRTPDVVYFDQADRQLAA
jgi:putative transposase